MSMKDPSAEEGSTPQPRLFGRPGADRADPTMQAARDAVDRFLRATMIPDPEAAALYLAHDVRIRFTGGVEMRGPADMAAYNARRYAWVKKSIERYDIAADGEAVVVYSVGTLYGAWPNGAPFSGNRYIDRFVVRDGKITQIDVWNDSAERLLAGE
jgi:ketosteroid isomerase-like protein